MVATRLNAAIHTRLLGMAVPILLAAGCGGGAGQAPAPAAPTPTIDTPTASVCATLGLTSSANILNGVECPTGNTAVVLLNMRDRAGFAVGACSGTLIADRAILTAAHCIKSEVQLVRVFLGSGPEIVAASFTAHPGYRGGTINDVAIVIMSEPVGRRPMPLLLSREARAGETAVIAGWGRNQQDIPATFRAGSTIITATGTVLETQFGPNVASICSGDSGGPILLSEGGVWSIAGVSSATSENVCNTGTNFYVALRTTAVSSFILGLVPDAVQR
ncbi:MAG: trypsin-like serine protease [Cyanobacteria bacterium]|nr:trypsin-like serine protease [Cyanobacteriota bacterium]